MDMNLTRQLKINHLRLISALADHGQLSLAAEALAITQPAASRMLAEIEGILVTKLCERHARGMELTPIGKVLARRAHNMLVEMRDLAREIAELKVGKEGNARIGAVTGAAVGYVVPAIQKIKTQSPAADILLDVSPSDALIRDLVAGHYDFVLGRLPPTMNPNEFIISSGKAEVITCTVNAEHELAQAEQVSLHELGHYNWVMQASGAPIREAVKSAFLEANAPLPRNITDTSSLLAMIAMLSASNTIAPVAQEVFDLLTSPMIGATFTSLALDKPIIVAPYHMITVKGRRLSPLASRLYALVQSELAR